MIASRVPPLRPARRRRGQMAVPIFSFFLSLAVGIAVGVIVGMLTETPWLGIVIGVAAMIVTGLIAGAIYYRSDFKRYMRIRRM